MIFAYLTYKKRYRKFSNGNFALKNVLNLNLTLNLKSNPVMYAYFNLNAKNVSENKTFKIY